MLFSLATGGAKGRVPARSEVQAGGRDHVVDRSAAHLAGAAATLALGSFITLAALRRLKALAVLGGRGGVVFGRVGLAAILALLAGHAVGALVGFLAVDLAA